MSRTVQVKRNGMKMGEMPILLMPPASDPMQYVEQMQVPLRRRISQHIEFTSAKTEMDKFFAKNAMRGPKTTTVAKVVNRNVLRSILTGWKEGLANRGYEFKSRWLRG